MELLCWITSAAVNDVNAEAFGSNSNDSLVLQLFIESDTKQSLTKNVIHLMDKYNLKLQEKVWRV